MNPLPLILMLSLLLGTGVVAGEPLRVAAIHPLKAGARVDLSIGDRLQRVAAHGDAIALNDTRQWRWIKWAAEAEGSSLLVEGRRKGEYQRWQWQPWEMAVDLESDADTPVAALVIELEQLASGRRTGSGSDPYDKVIAATSEPFALAVSQLLGVHAALRAGQADIARVRMQSIDPDFAPDHFAWQALILRARAKIFDAQRDPVAAQAMRDQAAALYARFSASAVVQVELQLEQAEGYFQANDNATALTIIEPATSWARECCDSTRLLARVESLRSRILIRLDRRDEAYLAAKQALDIERAIDPKSEATARLGVVMAARARAIGRMREAQSAVDAAFEYYAASSQSTPDYAAALLERGVMRWYSDHYAEARSDFERALALYKSASSEDFQVAAVFNNLGALAGGIGDLSAARSHLESALKILTRLGTSRGIARAYYNLGLVAEQAGNWDGARTHLTQAIDLQRAINPHGQSLGTSLASLASIEARLGNETAAERLFSEAAVIYESLDRECYCLASVYRDLGRFEQGRGRFDAARRNFERAREVSKREGSDADAATDAHGLGEAWLGAGDAPKALAEMRKAATIRERILPDTAELASSLYGLGRTESALGRAEDAFQHYCEAAAVLDRASARVDQDSGAVAMFRTQYHAIYRACMSSYLDRGEVRAAFEVLERSRARAFVNVMQQRRLDFRHWLSSEERELWHAREAALAKARSRVGESNLSPTERSAAARHAREATSAWRSFVALATERVPALRALASVNADARFSLPQTAVVLSYSVGPSETVVFYTTATEQRVHRIPIGREGWRARVDRFRALILSRDDRTVALHTDSAELHRVLISDVLGSERPSLLLVSPEGPLYELPFSALWDASTQTYLIERMPVAVIDSLRSLAWISADQTSDQQALLAVADPSPVSGMAGNLELSDTLRDLPALPGAVREVEAIAQLNWQKSRILRGLSATEPAVERAAQSASVLHFAVHALLDAQRPLESALVLGASVDDPEHEGLWHAWEILERVYLRRSLVVLAACDSANGKELPGEGLWGLTRTFQLAGASAVVASLWPVEDNATSALMGAFYARAQRDPEALRMAAVSLLRGDAQAELGSQTTRGVGALSTRGGTRVMNYRHPFYWAGFQYYGLPPHPAP